MGKFPAYAVPTPPKIKPPVQVGYNMQETSTDKEDKL